MWVCELVFLLGCSASSSSKASNALCCDIDKLIHAPKFCGQTGPLAWLWEQSALFTHFLAQELLDNIASRCSLCHIGWGPCCAAGGTIWLLPGQDWEGLFQATPKFSQTGFLIRRSQEPRSAAGWGMAQLFHLGIGRPCSRARTHLETQIRQTCTLWIPWSDCTTHLKLQMSKATGWDYCLGSEGRYSFSQDLSAGHLKPSPLLHLNQTPSGGALRIPLQSLWGKTRAGLLMKWPTMLGCWMSPLGTHFLLEEL